VLWVVVFLVIALAGLGMLISYAVWLAHKAADVFSEVQVLAGLGAQLAELAGEVSPPREPSAQRH
jgi:hypothetical protein